MIRILILSAHPTDLSPLRLGREVRLIQERLRAASSGHLFEIVQEWAVRVTDLQECLLRHRPHIVHFSGHGSEHGAIFLEDSSGNGKAVAPEALKRLFSVLKDNVSCVVLNACYSEAQAAGIAESVDFVVGMSNSVTDASAIAFAASFYQAIGWRQSVRSAFDLGRLQIELEGLGDETVPLLKVRPGASAEAVLAREYAPDSQRPMKTPVADTSRPSVTVYPDASPSTFVKHLANHNVIWVVGITNEHLADYMMEAYTQREGRAWDEVRIIFQARHLADYFGEPNRIQSWDHGVRETMKFFLGTKETRAKTLDIRHTRRVVPFVGQLYDHSHVRVTFLLPVRDLRRSCYLNFVSSEPLSDPATPASSIDVATSIEAANRQIHMDVKYAFQNLKNASTPLLSANVIGTVSGDGSFVFRSLIPQNNWRHYRKVLNARPAHLVVFVLLHDGERVFLQFRTANNANGQQYTYGVIPGKVNDEDFDLQTAEPIYWSNVYRMQAAFDALAENVPETTDVANAARTLATESFSDVTGVKKDVPISEERLIAVCRRAATRYLDEKLGLEVNSTRLVRVRDKSYVVHKQEYSLFVELFAVRVSADELQAIAWRRPFAELNPLSLDRMRVLQGKGELTMFLDQNFAEIVSFLKGADVR